MSKKLVLFATSFILSSLLLVGSVRANSAPNISITPDTSVVLSSGDSVRIWIYASDPDVADIITVEKTLGAGTYVPKTEPAPISDEFYFHPDTIGIYTFIFPVTDEQAATSSDTTNILLGPLVVDFRQSANDDSPYPPGDVHWIGSILQQSNSKYYEGMSSLQRLVFTNIPKTAGHVHTLNFSHQANKSADIHAYDFLTSWPQGVQAGTEIGGSTMFVSVNECGPEIGPPHDLGAICSTLHASGFTATPAAPDAMGTLIGDDVASSVIAYEANLGNRTVKIYGNTPISAASIAFNGYTGSGDMYADYTLTWTSSSDSIVIEMAGHLAAGTDPVGQTGVGYGAGRGSANISGGPYHFKLSTLDGASLGSQDNQIKGADILLPPPVCDVTPSDTTVCVGGSATFTDITTNGTPPYTYCWTKRPYSDPCLSTTATLTISNATIADADSYRVIVTDANNLADTCYVVLMVHPQPTCSVDPPSAAICEGESQQFCVQPTGGTPPYTYLWSPGGEGTQCITVNPPAGSYTYWVKVTDANDCTTSCGSSLDVVENPTCTIDPPSAAICEGESQQFCVQPTGGTPPYSYLWSPGGEVTDCITVSPPAGSYTYWVKVTDANDCTTSCGSSLEVVENPSCTIDPPSAVICEGESQQFCVQPTGGTPPYTYLWSPGGEVTDCITVSPPAGSYTYWVKVTDANDCTTSCGTSLEVGESPSCTIDPPSAQICEGESQEFCVQPTGGTPPYSYLWSPGGEVTDCITVSPPAGSYTYWVKVTDANDCTTSCGTSLEVGESPSCTIDPPSAQICEGESQEFCVQPTGGTPPYSYLWSPGGEVTDCITVSPPAGSYTYWVKVTDANDCTTSCGTSLEVGESPSCTIDPPSAQICEGGCQQFCVQPTGGTPPYTYEWYPDGEVTQCITKCPLPGSYTYWVKVTDANDCTTSCGTSLDVVENPTCTIDPPTDTICEGDLATFCVVPSGTPPFTYLWSPGGEVTECITVNPPTGSYTYWVKVTDAQDCTSSCEATLEVVPNPSCTIDPPSAAICEGESQQFCVQPTGGTPPYTYLWSPGGEGTQCITVNPSAGSYTYWVKVTDANDCTTSCGATLDVVENPTCTIDPPSAAICEGESQQFCVQPTGGTPPYSYLWSPGGEVTQCITVNPPAGSYTYWVKVTDANDCTTSCEATLDVGESPSCTIDPPTDIICEGDQATFCVVPTGGAAPYTYLWSPGGEVTQCITVSPPAGSSTYWVKVTDANDCTTSCGTSLDVVENPSCTIDPPSAAISEGDCQEFCVQPSGGTPPYTYLWSPGGEVTQCITECPPAGSYAYWVKVTDAHNCTTSCATSLTVWEGDTVKIPNKVYERFNFGHWDYFCWQEDIACDNYIIPDDACPPYWGINPGDWFEIPIILDGFGRFSIGGFELEVEFDYIDLTFYGAMRGGLLERRVYDQEDPPVFWSWEYFTYRVLPCTVPHKYKILLFGQADMPDGLFRKGYCLVAGGETDQDPSTWWYVDVIPGDPPDTIGATLAWLKFQVANNELLRDLKLPIAFEWEHKLSADTNDAGQYYIIQDWDCAENTFSSCSGNDLYASNDPLEFDPFICSDPEQYPPLAILDFVAGGVHICSPCTSFKCVRGDINLNHIAYETADAVLFARYFVEGVYVFTLNMDEQICATDVNADGRTLTLSDLIYLIRVILRDAPEIGPKLGPSSEIANVIVSGNTITTECASPIGAILFEFDSAVVPTLLATNMEMVNKDNKILVWSSEGYSIKAAAEVLSFAGDAELVIVTAVDRDSRELQTSITAKVAPTAFALNPAYPNPFNPFTNLSFTLPEAVGYSLNIYNVAGQLVRSYESMGSVGLNVVIWDGKDNAGNEVSSGVYFYKLNAAGFTATQKMVMMK